MPKMKTRRAAAKRYSATGTGKVRRRQGGKSHLLAHKSRKRKRRLKKVLTVHPSRAKLVNRSLPDI